MVSLNCPSCGGSLELPDHLGVAHCMYCGTRITVPDNELQKERRNLKRYKELCKVALQAKNYDEAILYCNKVLEVDPQDIDAWIDKAMATFRLSTRAKNRYMEATKYLKRAAEIAPEDTRIVETMEEITETYAWWLNRLGLDELKNADRVYRIHNKQTVRSFDLDGILKAATDVVDARKESTKHYRKAMDYFLTASQYLPSETGILSNIATCAETAHWISWNALVQQKTESLQFLNAKRSAQEELPQLKSRLATAQEKLDKLRSEGGFLSGLRINDAASKVSQLEAEIVELEVSASYQPPTTRLESP